MRFLLLMFLFLLTCCASSKFNKSTEFDIYVKDFEDNCKTKIIVPIEFAELPDDVLGRCTNFRIAFTDIKLPQAWRSIQINPKYWKTASKTQREATMLHEFGHCVLDLEHDSTIIDGYFIFRDRPRPRTLMFPYDFPEYALHREEYRKQFFNQCK